MKNEFSRKLMFEIYEKHGENFIGEVDISSYPLELINKICPPEDPADIEYCDGFFVELHQFNELKKYIPEISEFSYEEFDFNIITRRI